MDKGGRSYRFNLRVAPDWIVRVRAAAEQRGISMADFVIMVLNERLNVTEPPPAPEPTRPRGRPRKEAGQGEAKPKKKGKNRKG